MPLSKGMRLFSTLWNRLRALAVFVQTRVGLANVEESDAPRRNLPPAYPNHAQHRLYAEARSDVD